MNLFGPIFLMIALYFLIWIYMFITRLQGMMINRISADKLDIPSKKALLPENLNLASYNFTNLFEMPLLFLLFAIACQQMNLVDEMFINGSYLFIILRYVHSFIHVTYNRVMHRFTVYVLSSAILWYLWLRLFTKYLM